MNRIGRKFCVTVAFTLVAARMPVMAQAFTPADEAKLVAFLDKETRPGLLTFGKYGRLADGNYVVSAVFHRELRNPLNKLTGFCTADNGSMRLLVSAAGTVSRNADSAELALQGETFRVDQSDLFEWSGKPRSLSAEPALGGFEHVFDKRLVAGRSKTVADADANPPLGLFGCFDASKTLKWAVSIMAGDYGGSGWLYLKMLPVTHDFLAVKRQAMLAAKQNEVVWQTKQAEQQQHAEAYAEAENRRLAPWRKALTIGSETNCGLVIDDRGAVLEIQLPTGNTGPNGERTFWSKRDALADYPFPRECGFGQ
jgi:hypothetical protein